MVSVRVQRQALRRAQPGELLDQHLEVLAQQRLAAGEANLAHAVAGEQARQPRDLLEAQQCAVRQILVILVEHFLRHAVAAAEVAAVGDADAQVGQRSRQPVEQHAGGRHGGPGRRGARCATDLGDFDDMLLDSWEGQFTASPGLIPLQGSWAGSDAAGAVDLDADPADEGGLVAGQVERRVGDVQRRRKTPERNGGAELRAHGVVDRPAGELGRQAGVGVEHRVDAIDADVVGTELGGQRLAGGDHGAFGAVVPGEARAGAHALAVEAMLMNEPPPLARKAGTAWIVDR